MPKRLNIMLSDTLYHQIKELSTKELRSVSNMIEFALNAYINGNGAGISFTPYSPNTTHLPIPETPYKITAQQPTQSQPEKPRKRTIIGDKLHPLLWLDENNIDPNDVSETAYNKLHACYPDVDIPQFIKYQHERQNRYTPDPNDPYDPTINNPYLKNK